MCILVHQLYLTRKVCVLAVMTHFLYFQDTVTNIANELARNLAAQGCREILGMCTDELAALAPRLPLTAASIAALTADQRNERISQLKDDYRMLRQLYISSSVARYTSKLQKFGKWQQVIYFQKSKILFFLRILEMGVHEADDPFDQLVLFDALELEHYFLQDF